MYWWDRTGTLMWAEGTKLYDAGVLKATGAANIADMVSFGSSSSPTLIVAEVLNGGHTLHTWSTAAYATLVGTSIPNVTKLMVRFGRLLGTVEAANPSRIYWCDVDDATQWGGSWGEGGFIDVAAGQDGAIVDWIDVEGILYILKQRGIYRIVGYDAATYEVEKVTDIQNPKVNTIADCGKGTLYVCEYGVLPLGRGAGDNLDLTHPIETEFRAAVAAGTASAVYSADLGCYVVVTGATTAYVSNIPNRPDVWTKFVMPLVAERIYSGNGLWVSLTGTGRGIYKYSHTATTDNTGAAVGFTPVFKTGNWDLEEQLKLKNLRFLQGDLNGGESATATVKVYEEGSGTESISQALAANAENRIKCNRNFRRAALEITYSSLTGPVYFGGAELLVTPKGDVA